MTKTATPKPVTTESEAIDRLVAGVSVANSRILDILGRFESARAGVENEKRLEATITMLEAKIADQAMQIARMEGYLDRVEEDDQERAGVVELEQGPKVTHARPPRRHFGAMGSSLADVATRASGGSGVMANFDETRPGPRRRRFRWSEDR